MELSDAYKALNLDANASFGLLPEVAEGLRQHFQGYLNPSSIHCGGQAARSAIEEARTEIAGLLKLTRNERIVFTSGATESNNMALQLPFASAMSASQGQGAEIVVSAMEHPSVLEPAERLQRSGHSLEILSPTSDGKLSLDKLRTIVGPATKVVSFMYANNETGHIFPISNIATIVREANASTLIHCDGVQALGKIEFSFPDLDIDMLSLSAHKIGGLTGVGALVVSEKVVCNPLLSGGPQEARWRAGTENVLGIISFGLAARVLRSSSGQREEKMRAAQTFLRKALAESLTDLQFNSNEDGLPNTLNVSISGIRADDLVVALDMEGILISSGAACASGKPEPSHVLLALGLTPEQARQSIRISCTGMLSKNELEQAAQKIITCVRRMRGKL